MEKQSQKDPNWLRIATIVEMILENPDYLEGKNLKELIVEIKNKYSVGQRQAYRYLKSANQKVLDIKLRDTEKNLDRALIDREYLLRKAKTANDNKLLLEVMKDRDRLLGLYIERSKTDISFRQVEMGNFTDHGLERLARGEDIADVMQDPLSYKLINVAPPGEG